MDDPLNFPLVNLANDGELRSSTEAVALGFELQHKNVMALLKRHLAQIEMFGLVAFETRARLGGKHGGGDVEYALLNERQAMLLASMMKNTAKVLDFKVRLVAEFARMAETLHNRDLTMWQRRIKFEAKDQQSKAIGTIGSLMMTKRRVQKKPLDAERFLIEAEMQPGMFVS